MKSHSFIHSLALKLPIAVVFVSVAIAFVNAFIGYREFKNLFEGQYEKQSHQLAYIALSYLDGDKIVDYANGAPADEDWYVTNEMLSYLTELGELAFISVVVLAPEPYNARTYVFNTVNTQVDKRYKAYEVGHVESLEKKSAAYKERLARVVELEIGYSDYAYTKSGGHVTTAIPVKNSDGNPVAILSVVKPMSEVLELRERYLHSTIVASFVFMLLFVAIALFAIISRIVRPILFISEETSHFAEHKGELSGLLQKIKNKDELGLLARSVEKMSADMLRYIGELTTMTAEKERISAELDVATQIQADMLPRIFPPYADLPEVELFATMDPAKEVGGDFYDFFRVDDDHFAVVVGDVSGKGVPASLFMVVAKTLLKNAGLHGEDMADIFTQVNNQLCEGNDAGLFVTCWMGILTVSTGELRFANAGHTMPILYHDGAFTYLNSKPNLMLAAMQGMPYTEHTIHLERGDRLFIYTDGVTEATDEKNQLYGEDRLLSAIRKTDGLSCKARLEYIRGDIDAFVRQAPQFDDITMLEMSLKKLNLMQTKIFDATEENMDAVNDFIHACLPKNCPDGLVHKIDLAVEEIYINIAHYSGSEKAEILCSLSDDPVQVAITFKDSGKQFNPLAKDDPDITLSAEERDIGGLGIFLTKKFMDEVTYEYTDGKNILMIKKTLTV